MKWRRICISLAAVFLSAACSPADDIPGITADIIFIGDNIITMDDATVAAVAVVGDRIHATGSREEILALRSASTRVVNLGERALLPGFIDAHGHFLYVGLLTDTVNLSSPPIGPAKTIDDIVSLLRDRIASENIPAGDWVFGYGYDDSLVAEGRHPDRDDLDRASSVHPIVIRHVTGDLTAANSAALAAQGITRDTADPAGGIIRRRPGSRVPNGIMEATAMALFPNAMTNMSNRRMRELLRAGLDIHAAYGLTTVQDGGASLAIIDMMRQEAAREPFAIDIVAFAWINPMTDAEVPGLVHSQDYRHGFRLGGVKFGLDGSPLGRTAWLTEPYNEAPPGASDDYVADATYDADKYNARMKQLLARGMPVLAHANGDAAIDMMINGVAAAVEGGEVQDHRAVVIHGQLMRADQLDRVKDLGIVPSYYAAHPYFWGDRHRVSFGEDRAAFISPLRATIERGIPFTIHNDAPDVPPDIMRLIWIAVNRETRSGYVLGPDQRVTVMEALHAGAAYQYFEEDEKGSITPGKRADLVILGANPLIVDPDTIKDIPVLETFARGQSVYRRD